METFDISQAIVIPSMKDPENTKMEVGRAAADLLQLKISDGMRIGITWGSTIYHVVNQFNPKPLKNAIVYQLMGGTGACDPDTDGREQTQSMANKLKAKSYILQAPLIVQSKQLRNLLLKEPLISQTLKEAQQVDLAITSLGTNDPIDCNLLKLGHFTRAKCRELRKRGAVGDLCGWHLDINGQLCELDLHDRIVGISLEQISRIKTVIAVAIGERKAEIILACLRGGYIDYLVTDELAAIKVLSLNRG
jgi:DNA-binding transcriptional regulator LsrR (DeoR family)